MKRLLALSMLVFATGARAAPIAGPICGTQPAPPAAWRHVIWIFLENHSYGQIVGNGEARFINRTLIPDCGLATNFHNITHPSLQNYIAATSGLAFPALGALAHDCNPVGGCRTGAESIFQLAPSWRVYAESMPRHCYHWPFGGYVASHNPAPYYASLTGCSDFDLGYRAFRRDLDADTLPAFAFVTPNLCHDMHSCAVGTGDAWLAHAIAHIVGSAAYRRGDTAVFVTFDEGDKGGSNDCATNRSDANCHVLTAVVSPSTPPHTRARALFNHYSLLRTTEEMLGLEPLLGRAKTAASMRAAFNL
jgi:phosphatidylinositol-3-phosphatase